MSQSAETRSLTPHLPTYQEARHFIRILDGVSYAAYRGTYDAIWSQRGTPQEQMDWTDPDAWIANRLDGTEQALARRIWEESEGELNPRYLRGSWYLSQTHRLLEQDVDDILRLTERGREFLAEQQPLVAEIDRYEGLLSILDIIRRCGSGRLGDFLPEYTAFCHAYTGYRSESPIKGSLRDRLQNLLARDYIGRAQQYTYAITEEGRSYVERHQAMLEAVEATTESGDERAAATTAEPQVRSLTPGLPLYGEDRHFLRILDGVPYTQYRNTYNEIWEQRGSPQAQVDWTDPDAWIAQRLTGEEQALARRIWKESGGELNPRYLRGSWYLTTKHELLQEDQMGVLRISRRGERFLRESQGDVVAEVDAFEGIFTILRIVAERGPDKRSEFLSEYAVFCRTFTGYQSETPIRGSLYDRLVNLIDRGYVDRSGQVYQVSDSGLAYLDQYAHLDTGRTDRTRGKQSELRRLTKTMTREARQQLADFLSSMDPFKFESLVKFLLEEMGYRDVETTSPTNDKGVDVVADIDLGISSVREVVQVKRRKSNVGRRVLDQLRGSLHRFNAVRGTIITTGDFTSGTRKAAFETGASPITLINGDKLLDLLIEHGIGVSKQTMEFLEFDAEKLAQFEVQEAEAPEI